MDTPRGTIVSLDAHAGYLRAMIEVDTASCPRCAAGKGCGAGLLGTGAATRQLEMPVDPALGLAVGDEVVLRLAESSVLHAAAIVYGLPMLGAIVAAVLAYAASLGDAGAASAALLGLAIGVAAGRWWLRRRDCLRQFLPAVERPH